jgi:hypothetical protein
MSAEKTTLKIFRPLNTIWHEKSQLVFKSRTEHIVVGKWINDQLKKLSSSDVEQCLNLKFKYDENEVEDEDAVEEVGEGDGEEEVGTESGQDDGEEEVVEGDKQEVVEDAVGEMVNNEETKKEEKPDYGKNESLVSTVLVTKINQQKQSIFNEMESLVGLVNKEVVDLEEKFKQKSKDFEELLENFNKLEKDHKKLQAKFDGIKQLFN